MILAEHRIPPMDAAWLPRAPLLVPVAAPPTRGARDDGFGEYTARFLREMQAEETAALPLPNYLEFQEEINPTMRRTLIEWLVEIRNETKLHSHSLQLAVNLMDRYLSRRNIPRRDFQLLGITCLFVASKYHDIPRHTLPISLVLSLCCDQYTRADIHEMERRVLVVTDFDLSWKSPGALLNLLCGEVRSSDGRDEQYGGPGRRRSDACLLPGPDRPYAREPARRSLDDPAFAYGYGRPPAPSHPTFPSADLPRELVELAHRVAERSALHSRFIGLRGSTVALAALVAADRILGLVGRPSISFTHPSGVACVCSLLDIEPNVPRVALHLAECALQGGLVTGLPPAALPTDPAFFDLQPPRLYGVPIPGAPPSPEDSVPDTASSAASSGYWQPYGSSDSSYPSA